MPTARACPEDADLTAEVGLGPQGRQRRGQIRQNIVIALATVGLLLTGVLMGGVTMAAGMLFHEGAVLIVIANAMRLLRRATPAHSAPLSTVARESAPSI